MYKQERRVKIVIGLWIVDDSIATVLGIYTWYWDESMILPVYKQSARIEVVWTATDVMSSKPQNTTSDKLRQDFRGLYIRILDDLKKRQSKNLPYVFFGTLQKGDLLSLEEAGKISWTDVSSLKEGLSDVGRVDLANALEEYEIRKNLAVLLDAFARIRKEIPRQNFYEYIETIAGSPQNLLEYIEAIARCLEMFTGNALDKNKFKIRSLRKSENNIEEVMISLKEKIETNVTEPWTKRLMLLIVIAGELLSETETETEKEEFPRPLPEAVKRCSTEICSGITTLEEWVGPINRCS